MQIPLGEKELWVVLKLDYGFSSLTTDSAMTLRSCGVLGAIFAKAKERLSKGLIELCFLNKTPFILIPQVEVRFV